MLNSVGVFAPFAILAFTSLIARKETASSQLIISAFALFFPSLSHVLTT